MKSSSDVPRGEKQINRERDHVRRIQPAQPSLPEWTKANVGLDSRRPRFGPLQVNTKSGNDEEQKDADVTKRAQELNRRTG